MSVVHESTIAPAPPAGAPAPSSPPRAAGRWKRPELPAAAFAVLSAAAVVLLNNAKLFVLMSERMDLLSMPGAACLGTVFLAITGMVAGFLLVFGWPYALKPLVVLTLLVSSVLGFFSQEFGTIFDLEMIRNIAENLGEGNRQEARELASLPLAVHALLFGILPSLLVLAVRVRYSTVRRELATRACWTAALLLLFALVTLPNVRFVTFTFSENLPLKRYATPTYAVHSFRKYLSSLLGGGRATFGEIGTDAVVRKSGRLRTVGVLVVGETARADHFSLNGYPRDTNPRLARRRLLNYPDTRSSGTTTATSVPCMFSFLGRERFSREKASRQSNLVDVLVRAGVEVVWIDNNSGSKGVCERLGFVDLRIHADPGSPYRTADGVYDEALVGELETRLASARGDVLVVLHTIGSHGPAYYRRYPPEFEAFRPCCRDDSPQRSSRQELVNAYDNTIVYTDHVLDRLISVLERRPDTEATFLWYLSDHGESLGENGVFLHGLPYALAPDSQTHVPMLGWLSPALLGDRSMDFDRLLARTAAPCSHDHLPHTMLGLFEVKTSLYREEMDLLRAK